MRRMSVSLAVVASVLCAAGIPAAALNVAEWSKAFASPKLAGTGIDAAGKELTFGHLQLSFRSGRLVPVAAGGRVVGVLFAGQGNLRYTSTDPVEAAVYRTNVDRVSPYKVGSDGSITDTVTVALVMLSGGAEPITGGVAGQTGSPPGEAVAALATHLERFSLDEGVRYTQLMPQAMVDPPAEPLAMAEIEAGRSDMVYAYDTLRDHDEWIAVLRKSRSDISFFADLRLPDLLSDQLIGRKRLEPNPRSFMLTAVDLTMTNPDGLRADLDVSETYQALAPIRALGLSLWSAHAGTQGAGAKPAQHGYVVKSVTLASGEPLAFAHVNDDLVVELPRRLVAGEQVTVRVQVGGDILFRPGNDSYWILGTSSWLPVPGRLDMQAYTYHAVCKVRKPFTVFSDGVTVRRWDEGDLACAEFREDRPIQFPVIIAGKYSTHSEARDGVTVRVARYAMADPKTDVKLANNVLGLLQFYKLYLGDYPFRELELIEINDYGFGQAPAGIVFITKEAFSPLQDETSRLFSQGVNARLAHEVAHAWWGHVEKMGSLEDQWISESLAEYYAAFAMGKLRRESEFKRAVNSWKASSRFVKDKGSVYLADELSGERAWDDRYALLYAKGPLILDALRKEVGDDAFFTIWKSYLKNFHFKYGETRHVIGLTNFITKKDYTPWFDRYLFGTEWP
ncbi:MAG: M1 family metallopeptidase [Acidobacteriota bacterium]